MQLYTVYVPISTISKDFCTMRQTQNKVLAHNKRFEVWYVSRPCHSYARLLTSVDPGG